jgi:hypothetical protein
MIHVSREIIRLQKLISEAVWLVLVLPSKQDSKAPGFRISGPFVLITTDKEIIMATVTECWSALRNRFAGLRQHIAKRLLENELASIIRTVAAHKRNRVPAGAPQYRSLWHTANQKVDSFCVAYWADRAEIEAQIPALKELCDLVQVPKASKKAIKIAGGLVTGVVVFTLSGFAAGVIQWLFDLGMNFAHHLLGSL